MVVHPAYGNYKGTLVNALMWHLRDLPMFQSGEQRPGLVHRLDKDTSGILVVAKNEYSLNGFHVSSMSVQPTGSTLRWHGENRNLPKALSVSISVGISATER